VDRAGGAETELAFVHGKDLAGKSDLRAVREAIAYAVAALEIAVRRVAKCDISLSDTGADYASSGMFVLGSRRVALDQFELAGTAAELGDPLRAGQVVLSGALGHIVPVGDGDRVTASLSGLDEVAAQFGTRRALRFTLSACCSRALIRCHRPACGC